MIDLYYKVEQDVRILSPSGKLIDDLSGNILLNYFIELNPNENVIVDCSEMEYVNSTGINYLVKIFMLSKKVEGDLVFVNVSPRLQELFGIIKLNAVFEVRKNIKDGVEVFKNKSI